MPYQNPNLSDIRETVRRIEKTMFNIQNTLKTKTLNPHEFEKIHSYLDNGADYLTDANELLDTSAT